MADVVDVGGSVFWLTGNKVLGADAKVMVLQAEEGPSMALRFCYTYTDLTLESVNVSTKTFAPQLLISRRMEFADPYLGLGLMYVRGTIDAGVSQTAKDLAAANGVPLPEGAAVHTTGNAYGGLAFGGISLRVPRSGLRLTIEMAYSTSGTTSLGTKVGFNF
jgi:hypothetical protein